MSCPYYWYNNHYACRKTEKDVDEDTYYKFCRDYSYDDCPFYKGQDSSGCFLTSACVEAKGLPDNCYELNVLRRFRETYLRKLEGGADEIAKYYFLAPLIVAEVKKKRDSLSIFNMLYEDLVVPCVDMIERGENESAHNLYKSTVTRLQNEYLQFGEVK